MKKGKRVNRAIRSRERAGKATPPSSVPVRQSSRPVKGREACDDPHPLVIAWRRGDLGCHTKHRQPESGCHGCARFSAGDELRTLCATLEPSTRDSTRIDGIGGGNGVEGWLDSVMGASDRLKTLCAKTGGRESANWIISLHFAGLGWPMREAILAAGIPCHVAATKMRICEALNALAGIKPQWRTPRVKSEPVVKKTAPVFRCANCLSPVAEDQVQQSELGDYPLCAKCVALEPPLVARPKGKAAAINRYRRNLNLPPEIVDNGDDKRSCLKKVA